MELNSISLKCDDEEIQFDYNMTNQFALDTKFDTTENEINCSQNKNSLPKQNDICNNIKKQ